MNTFRYQKGLMGWFIFNKDKPLSLSSAKNLCMNMLYIESTGFDSTNLNAISQILVPLVRLGVLEFNGKNGFVLAPSCAIIENDFILTCNVPDSFLANYNADLIFDSKLGIRVYNRTKEIKATLLHNKIIISKFKFSSTINQLQTIDNIINSWKDTIVTESSKFQYLTSKMQWETGNNPPMQGVFKKSSEVYSERLIKCSTETWKSLPLRRNHLDSINIAYTWHQLKNMNNINVLYSKSEKCLRINSVFFPIIIERLLILNTLLKFPCKFNVLDREYFLSHSDFDLVSTLFENKILLK